MRLRRVLVGCALVVAMLCGLSGCKALRQAGESVGKNLIDSLGSLGSSIERVQPKSDNQEQNPGQGIAGRPAA